jgi:hypothetical protein
MQVGDEVFFERENDGLPEAGYIIDLVREGETVFATCRYKDKAWSVPW